VENAALIALSRQMTLRRELDIVANNIANADTTGFKVEGLIVEEEVVSHARNFGVYGAPSFVLDQGIGRDFTQGLHPPDRPAAGCGHRGRGVFFRIGDPNGGRRTLHPRRRLHPRTRRPADHPRRRPVQGTAARSSSIRPRASRPSPQTAPSARAATGRPARCRSLRRPVGPVQGRRRSVPQHLQRAAGRCDRRPGPPGHAGRLQRQHPGRDHQPDRDPARL
jgi:hypothetical protein